ncbi:PAS domain-containing hybrid sensor histidine kinase/response regulator [Deinococcus roseus]|uniref:histidine kinase n=1 Tax=Deinococcus roseus TaxID=392414 RepID=A0ABQ2DDH1_9DEIO|nr:PAS domain-containing protein [Deinococcus roseus]GGJ52002.1 hypothetical protein GCM10008938_42510 [Deinococcus roseus]
MIDPRKELPSQVDPRLLLLAIQQSQNAVMITNRKDELIWVNTGFTLLTGYTLEEVEGKSPPDLLQGENSESIVTLDIQDSIARGQTFEGEVYNYKKDGSGYWALISVSALYDEKGDFDGFLCTQTDITERKTMERELSRYVQAIHKVEVSVLLTDHEDRLIWVNDHFTESNGFTLEEVRGKRPAEVLRGPNTDLDAAVAFDSSAVDHEPFRGEIFNYRKDGTGYWAEISATPLFGNKGEFQGFITISNDVTERKYYEAEMKRLNEAQMTRLAEAVRRSRNAVLVTDFHDCIEWANEGFTSLTGYTLEEVLGQRPGDILTPTGTNESLLQEIGNTIQAGGTFEGEIFQQRKNGSNYWAWISVTPLKNAAGEVQGFITIQTDITDRKSLEAELALAVVQVGQAQAAIESEKKALEANKAKSVFLANMSHELRTPLNAVLGFAQVMQRKPGRDEEDRRQLDIIQRSGEHLLELINDVLSISKIEAGKVNLAADPFDLHLLLQTVESMIRVRSEARKIELFFEIDASLPRFVRGDEGKLRQVLINLLSNAVKFTSNGGVVLRAWWEGSTAHFEVEDTGEGIKEEELITLFEPFVQTESGRKNREGTGLGLAISRTFVRLMGGDIRVRSSHGVGTTFEMDVKLPLAEQEAVRPKDERHVLGLEHGHPPVRLLVVDDMWENRTLMCELLQSVGFETREASNGQEAIEVWQDWHPHLIWMDIRMPVMDGYQATRSIRELEQTQGAERCKIIAFTASVFEQERTAILQSGCDDMVFKPFREETIFQTLSDRLGVRFRYADAPTEPQNQDLQPEEILIPERFTRIPEAVLTRLEQALRMGDDQAVLDLLDTLSETDSQLSKAIQNAVENFDFDVVLSGMGRS